ncbi:hypothetical protein MKW94_012623 [Papaver nudicaule]|uniref:Uncharacterized protein n=1 Tax=Papaver nudicaule TaxID=74823 RepID=A0AA41RU09_PAPNU|nr:hypothetical protein [Papaver nudicaule]
MSNFTTIRMVLALSLCLLLQGGSSYLVEAASGRINDREVAALEVIGHGCPTIVGGRCVNDHTCSIRCISQKYSGGLCLPNDIDKKPLGICCCLN